MARRVSVPSADDLFRRTDEASKRGAVHAVPDQPTDDRALQAADRAGDGSDPASPATPSGRVKHDEKMTVYVTADELLAVEHARLSLRSRHGVAVDRGRLVREAIHLALADLERDGAESGLVHRLREK